MAVVHAFLDAGQSQNKSLLNAVLEYKLASGSSGWLGRPFRSIVPFLRIMAGREDRLGTLSDSRFM
jgi:hypothetical protein